MSSLTQPKASRALYALAVGAFGIGTSEFVIMGLLLDVSRDLGVNLFLAGMLITGYALGVVVGAPILSLLSVRLPKKTMLLLLMGIFTLGNFLCAIAPNYTILMIARIITSLSHGAFFGVGSVVATQVVPKEKKASAIALMFTGLTIANILGVPFGTWLGQSMGYRATFWAVTLVGFLALLTLLLFVPKHTPQESANIRQQIKAVLKGDVLLSFLVTTLGFAGVFATLTYIAPFLTERTGFRESAISPLLLLFGAGIIIGNILGGKLADKNLNRALYLSLGALGVSLLLLAAFSTSQWLTAVMFTLFGLAGFTTVSPLQVDALSRAKNGATLASALNIAAFNLGNALGAYAGGLVIKGGVSLDFLPIVAAVFAFLALLIILLRTGLTEREYAPSLQSE